MYSDMDLSLEHSRKYLSGDPRKRKNAPFESEFFILSQGAWPIN